MDVHMIKKDIFIHLILESTMTRVKNRPMTIVNEACICVKNRRCPYNIIYKCCVKYYIISAAIHYVLGFLT